MNILEKDLFNYIFHPEILNSDKFEYISDNNKLFKSELELLKDIKTQENTEVSQEIIDKIIERMENYSSELVVVLTKININQITQHEQLVLAADSPNLEHKLRTDTFQDKNSEYLVKVITNEEQNKIFVFNKDNIELRNIKFNIKPSGQSFLIESTSKPFIISPKQEITEISITPDI